MRRIVLVLVALLASVLVFDMPTAQAAPIAYTQTTSGGLDEIWEVDMATGAGTLVGDTGLTPSTNGLAFGDDGVLYGENNQDLVSIDTDTGDATVIGDMGMDVEDMTVKGPGELWAIANNPSRLWVVDTATANATLVGPLDNGLLQGLANNCDTGDTYAASTANDELLGIDTTDATASDVGPFGTALVGGQLSFDSAGTLWMMAGPQDQPSTRRTYTVNTSTGAVTQVAASVGVTNVAGALAIQGPDCPDEPETTTTTSTTAPRSATTPVPAAVPATAVARTPAFTG